MLFLLIALCGLWLIWLWFKKPSALEPPELSGKLPFVGHGLHFVGDSVQMYNAFAKVSEEAIKKGGVVRLHMGPRMFYVVSHPEDSLAIATACLQKHYIYDFMRSYFANGLLNADVQTWKLNRKLINPAFSQQALDGFLEIFNSQARRLTDQFAEYLGKPFDHEHLLRTNNLETICSTTAGLAPDEYDNLKKQYLPHLEEMLNLFNRRVKSFWLHSDFMFNLSPLKRKHDEILKYVLELSNSIVQKKKTEMKMKNTTNSKNKSGKIKPFVEHILEIAEEHSSYTDRQIQGETDTIIAGGHDTSASALTFCLTLLGSHTEVQEKAYDEVLQVFGNSNRDVNKDDLSKLVYVEAILKETLRLYPSVPLIVRQLDKDVKLTNYTLKAKTGCFLPIFGINRHTMWGTDANEFRPERWLDKDTLPDPKYYAAFGLGRRSCIGKVYAYMSMKVTLSQVLRKYRVSSDISKMVMRMNTMLRPESGYHISLEQRN